MSSRMAGKSLRPAARPALILGFLILALCAAPATRGGCKWEKFKTWLFSEGTAEVFLELDYINGERTPPDPVEMNRWYRRVGIEVGGVLETNSIAIDDNCVSRTDVDDLLSATRTQSPPDGAWYIHGLVLPSDCSERWDDDEGYKYEGMLWVLDESQNGIGRREAFVILDKQFATSAGGQRHRTWVIAHEMAHVLNAHHCEFDEDQWGSYNNEFGKWTCKHFGEKKKTPEEVRPGGTPWGQNSPRHEEKIHKKLERDSCGDPYKRAYKKTDVTLVIDLEKTRYFPGEPIHVDLALKTKSPLTETFYYVENSLSRSSRYLEFEVGRDKLDLRPLNRPMLGYRTQKLALLSNSVKGKDLDIWYGLPREWVDWDGTEKSLWIRASYTIFGVSNTDDFSCVETAMKNCERYWIVSEPIEVKIGLDASNARLFDPAAHQSFTKPQTRRFLWLGGSDRLTTAKGDLQNIATEKGDTIYARYADLALGLNTGRRRLDPASRDAALDRLRALRQAETIGAKLPPSYQRRLKRQIERLEIMRERP